MDLLSGDQVLDEAKNLARFWLDMTREGKRRVVESIVEWITLDKDEIQIDLFDFPTPNQPVAKTSSTGGDGHSSEGNNPDGDGGPPPMRSISAIVNAFSEDMAKRRTMAAVCAT